MDAANVDLKAFTEVFMKRLREPSDAGSRYAEVPKHETNVWFELTTLLIPGENDSDQELDEMTKWVVKELGPDVPMHFTAFTLPTRSWMYPVHRLKPSIVHVVSRWIMAYATPLPATLTMIRVAAPGATIVVGC